MSITSSGEIHLSASIGGELGASGQVSLTDASDGSIATINTLNLSANRPDGSAPHKMSEFYSYDHDAATTVGNPSDTSISFSGSPGDSEISHAAVTVAIGNGSGGLDIWYTNNSGTVRGGLDVALSTNGTSYGSDIDVQNSSGYFDDGLSDFSGDSTLYLIFKYTPHSSLTESTSRTLNIKLNGVTNTGATISTDIQGGGGGGR
mgnify:FL=1|tara:strand:+ start:478 stop:1089 length:612 start_codon:yes stop_codon:yes gene_type:complete